MSNCRMRLARVVCLTAAIGLLIVIGAGQRGGAAQAERLSRLTATISADGFTRRLSTSQKTVAGILKEAGIELGPLDKVVPSPKDRVTDSSRITVTRVSSEIVSENEPVAFETVRTFTKSLRPGLTKQIRQGKDGQRLIHYRVRSENGVPVSRTKISSILIKRPVSRIVAIGSKGRYTSRGEWRTKRVLRMAASAYDPGPRSCGKYATGRTACGLRAGYGVVAVDPRVVRLGSKLYIEGYGHAVAADKGRAIKGARIDLGFNTYGEAIRFGRKTVTVHILEE